jgi:hypothetical protein
MAIVSNTHNTVVAGTVSIILSKTQSQQNEGEAVKPKQQQQ